jgi:hypothetical protein
MGLECLVVRPEHNVYAVQFIHLIYKVIVRVCFQQVVGGEEMHCSFVMSFRTLYSIVLLHMS